MKSLRIVVLGILLGILSAAAIIAADIALISPTNQVALRFDLAVYHVTIPTLDPNGVINGSITVNLPVTAPGIPPLKKTQLINAAEDIARFRGYIQ